METEQESLDQKIIGTVDSLCQQLGISSYNPTMVAWVSLIPRGKAMVEMPLDECILSKSQIMLPAAMRSKLEPDEWKPIIASALILSKKLRRKLLERTLIVLAALILVSASLFLTLPALLPGLVTSCRGGTCGTAPLGYYIAVYVGLTLPIIGTPITAILLGRKLKLVADRMAAEIVGVSSFLLVLNKIANLAAGQTQAKKRLGGPLSPFPSLSSRIINLQTHTSPA